MILATALWLASEGTHTATEGAEYLPPLKHLIPEVFGGFIAYFLHHFKHVFYRALMHGFHFIPRMFTKGR